MLASAPASEARGAFDEGRFSLMKDKRGGVAARACGHASTCASSAVANIGGDSVADASARATSYSKSIAASVASAAELVPAASIILGLPIGVCATLAGFE